MNHPPKSGVPPLPQHAPKSEWAKFLAGFTYAFRGLWYVIRTQRNMRVHIGIAVLAIGVGMFLHISALEFALIFIAIGAVFITEMINTVIETCIDMITVEYHPLARIAKDVAAGAVLVSAFLAVIIGLLVLGPHLWLLVTK